MGLSSVHEAVDEWFTGLHGFPAPPLLCELAIQRGQRLSKKAIDNLSRRWHLPLRIQAPATDRCWPLKKALAVYELAMQRHSLSLAELRDAVRLSNPVRHPDAKGGKPAQSQHVNRSPGLPLQILASANLQRGFNKQLMTLRQCLSAGSKSKIHGGCWDL